MATAKKGGRGGARNTGMVRRDNTSGLAGVWFQWRLGVGVDPVWHLFVCSAWTDKTGRERRTAYSLEKNGQEGALMRAINARVVAGLPYPSMEEALRALRKFLKES